MPTNGTVESFNTSDNIAFTIEITPAYDCAYISIDIPAGAAVDAVSGERENTAAEQFNILDGNCQGKLVVNEIDYDNEAIDEAEFIEIKNISGNPIPLSYFEIIPVNGTGPVIYRTIGLPQADLNDEDYFVVCGHAGNVPNCDLDMNMDGIILNDAPNAVAIQLESEIIDTVSYGGDTAGYTETAGTAATDNSSNANRGLSRYPDGTDSGDNNNDLIASCITPGAENGNTTCD